ncbi:MAG: uroporphyrinogen decarboxylase family protein [Oscillospiraceae bacterium]|nr:uroporphyrinogen decarboxylase family protein [Oscillospiraceae bacterium]
MTSLDRMLSAIYFEKPDQVPVFLNNTLTIPRLIGASVYDICHKEDKFAEALLAGYKFYGYDGVRVGIDGSFEPEAMGCELNCPENGFWSVKSHILSDPDNFNRLKIPDPYSSGRMPMMVNTVKRLSGEIGGKAFIGALVLGPAVLASQLMGVEDYLIALMTDPEYIGKLHDFCVEAATGYAVALYKAGAHGIVIGEAICSPQVIGAAAYRESIMPWHKMLISELASRGIDVHILHICGNAESIFSDVASTGAAGLDVDSPVDMLKERAALGNRMAFTGNIRPELLLNGSVDEVKAACAKALEAKGDSGGLVLNAGCCMALETPHENIKAMVEMARVAGCY